MIRLNSWLEVGC